MAAKKTKHDDDNINEPQVVENDVDDEDKTPAEREVTATAPMTFTVEIAGEEIELEDVYRKDEIPGAFMLLGEQSRAAKYLPGLLETIIGVDQTMMILDKGASIEEMGSVTQEWAKGRGVAGK